MKVAAAQREKQGDRSQSHTGQSRRPPAFLVPASSASNRRRTSSAVMPRARTSTVALSSEAAAERRPDEPEVGDDSLHVETRFQAVLRRMPRLLRLARGRRSPEDRQGMNRRAIGRAMNFTTARLCVRAAGPGPRGTGGATGALRPSSDQSEDAADHNQAGRQCDHCDDDVLQHLTGHSCLRAGSRAMAPTIASTVAAGTSHYATPAARRLWYTISATTYARPDIYPNCSAA